MWSTDWAARAACREIDPDSLFVPGGRAEPGQTHLPGVPGPHRVSGCTRWTTGIEFGVWGGMTERGAGGLWLRRRPEVTSWRALLEGRPAGTTSSPGLLKTSSSRVDGTTGREEPRGRPRPRCTFRRPWRVVFGSDRARRGTQPSSGREPCKRGTGSVHHSLGGCGVGLLLSRTRGERRKRGVHATEGSSRPFLRAPGRYGTVDTPASARPIARSASRSWTGLPGRPGLPLSQRQDGPQRPGCAVAAPGSAVSDRSACRRSAGGAGGCSRLLRAAPPRPSLVPLRGRRGPVGRG